MAVVKINQLTVDPANAAELEARFAARKKSVAQEPGFLGFELLRPTGHNTDYFVVTRWEDDESFNNWVAKRHPRDPKETVSTAAGLLEFEVVDL